MDQQVADRFKNRRKMAWLSFGMLCIVTLVMLYRLGVKADDPTAWTGIATVVLGCFVTIVTTYAITATVEQVKNVKV